MFDGLRFQSRLLDYQFKATSQLLSPLRVDRRTLHPGARAVQAIERIYSSSGVSLVKDYQFLMSLLGVRV